MKKLTFLTISFLFSIVVFGQKSVSVFKNFPKDANPKDVGKILSERFISKPHSTFGAFRATPPKALTYPDVCTWLGAFWFATETKDKQLKADLIAKFRPLLNEKKDMQTVPNHVDASVFGALPLELFLQTGEQTCKDLGLKYADAQWTLPPNWTLEGQPKRKDFYYGMLNDASIFQIEQKQWADKGYSWQTRLWLDDMFMITTLQAQAYKVTGEKEYIDRAANEMVMYMDSIQLDNGLFNHSPNVPFRWARGNGWMAVGFAELLRILPSNHPNRPKIMEGYKKMMASLLKYQNSNGMWLQVIDDQGMWSETSGTAMFTYAFITGVQNGWLDEENYGNAARKAWIALVTYINKDGDVTEVCEGTNIKNDREHYFNRKRIIGDLHGQAPVLWCAYALSR